MQNNDFNENIYLNSDINMSEHELLILMNKISNMVSDMDDNIKKSINQVILNASRRTKYRMNGIKTDRFQIDPKVFGRLLDIINMLNTYSYQDNMPKPDEKDYEIEDDIKLSSNIKYIKPVLEYSYLDDMQIL